MSLNKNFYRIVWLAANPLIKKKEKESETWVRVIISWYHCFFCVRSQLAVERGTGDLVGWVIIEKESQMEREPFRTSFILNEHKTNSISLVE